MTNSDSKYTDPELRTEIKERVQESDKGGKPGQWSARKAQMMASEYKKAMEERGEEPYTTDKSDKDDRQKNLSNWTEEEWQTSDGKAEAKQADGTERRYLPKKAWEKMSDEEKTATDEAKLEGGKEGHQFVSNTDAAKAARKEASQEKQDESNRKIAKDEAETDYSDKEEHDEQKASKRSRDEDEFEADDAPEDELESSDDDEDQEARPTKKAKKNDGGQKQTKKQSDEKAGKEEEANGKAGEKDEHGKPSSADRLPNQGQKVHWCAASGWCEGTVVEVLHKEKEVAGRTAKASQNDPRIVVKSAKSGKEAVHKPGAVYF